MGCRRFRKSSGDFKKSSGDFLRFEIYSGESLHIFCTGGSKVTLEIGTRGYISPRNRGTITHLCKIAGERKVKEVLSNCSKQALLGSKAIYNARNSPDWG